MADPSEAPSPSYAHAVEELEAILRRLDAGSVDVDQLSTEVARAADLLVFCRERLDTATVDVQRIVATVRATDAGEPPPTDAS